MNPTKTIVDQAEAALRLFFAESREDAARLLEMYGPLVRMFEQDLDAAVEVRHLVLDRFPAAEPPAVPGLDWLPAVEADAKQIVASLDVTVADKQLTVRPGEHTEKMLVYRGEYSGWIGICVCGFETQYYADRITALLKLGSHIVKATEAKAAQS